MLSHFIEQHFSSLVYERERRERERERERERGGGGVRISSIPPGCLNFEHAPLGDSVPILGC